MAPYENEIIRKQQCYLGGIDQPSTTYLEFRKYVKKWEYNNEVCKLLIVFEKAYDSTKQYTIS